VAYALHCILRDSPSGLLGLRDMDWSQLIKPEKKPGNESKRYCQLRLNWADFLPRTSNMTAEQSMSYEFVLCQIFCQIHLP